MSDASRSCPSRLLTCTSAGAQIGAAQVRIGQRLHRYMPSGWVPSALIRDLPVTGVAGEPLEIADFELNLVGGPGFEPGASRSRNLGPFVHLSPADPRQPEAADDEEKNFYPANEWADRDAERKARRDENAGHSWQAA
jgi:hypothetical protein